MADSLRLKGCKSISKHTGDEMLLRRPKRGGDIFKVPTWWNLKHTTQYVSAAIFKVTATAGELALVVPVDPETTDIIIKHDGEGNFTFPSVNGVDRVAVMSADLGTFYVEYQFSKISGGPVLKRTVNALPAAAEPEVVVVPEPEPEPEPPAEPTFAERVAAATFTYTVGINNIGDEETPINVYTLNGVDGPGIAGSVGDSFYFDFSAVAGNHPLAIFTDASKTTPVTVGVYTEGDALIFEPPITGTFSYQCINHANMGGDITVS